MKHIELIKLIEGQVDKEWKSEKFTSKTPLFFSKILMFMSLWLFLSSIVALLSAVENNDFSNFTPKLLMEILAVSYLTFILSKLILLARRFQISKEYKNKYCEKDVNTAYAKKIFKDLSVDIQEMKLKERDIKYARDYFLTKSNANFISRLYIEPIQTAAISIALIIGAFSIGPFNSNEIGGYDCNVDLNHHYVLRCWDRKELSEKVNQIEHDGLSVSNASTDTLNKKFLFLLMLAYLMLIFSLNNKKFIQTKIILNMVSYDSSHSSS